MRYERIQGTTCLLAITFLALASAAASASMEFITLGKLVASSDIIVIAEVLRVEGAPPGLKVAPPDKRMPAVRIATAKVLETWKGPVEKEVRFFASPLAQCDVSTADKGQRMVLCLGREAESGIMRISHGGRGGMPLRAVGNKLCATIDSFTVELPAGTRTIPGPEPQFSFMRSIELSKLKELVRAYAH